MKIEGEGWRDEHHKWRQEALISSHEAPTQELSRRQKNKLIVLTQINLLNYTN